MGSESKSVAQAWLPVLISYIFVLIVEALVK